LALDLAGRDMFHKRNYHRMDNRFGLIGRFDLCDLTILARYSHRQTGD
jgi:hypothetical protein